MDDTDKQLWRDRVEVIHSYINAYDVLRMNGVDLKQVGASKEEQIGCPFHGKDVKPSARVYPDSFNKKSHVWCFVCQEKGWDAIGLWGKFGGLSFAAAVQAIEHYYSIQVDRSFKAKQQAMKQLFEVPVKPEGTDIKSLLDVCEGRLKTALTAYRHGNNMTGYLAAGEHLDKIRHRLEHGTWTEEKSLQAAHELLAKLKERIQGCPVG